jgi:hypothetical protein
MNLIDGVLYNFEALILTAWGAVFRFGMKSRKRVELF